MRPRLFFALFGLVCLVPRAGVQAFSDVYFFGDSLSDTGNTCALLFAGGYAPGRCSNGEVWSDALAASLGFTAQASISGGNNFADGGDTTADLDNQITLLAIREFNQADPDALYVIWLGGNNVLDLPAAAGAMQTAVDELVAGLQRLRGLGARTFLVPNLPDIGRAFGTFAFPTGVGAAFTPAERDLANHLSTTFNALLAPALAAQSGVTIFQLDIFGLVEELFADPVAFGLLPAAIDRASDDTDFGIPCLNDFTCANAPQSAVADGFFLFDAVHPTTAMHAIIAERATELVPEPRSFLLGLSCLLTLLVLGRRPRAISDGGVSVVQRGLECVREGLWKANSGLAWDRFFDGGRGSPPWRSSAPWCPSAWAGRRRRRSVTRRPRNRHACGWFARIRWGHGIRSRPSPVTIAASSP